MKYEVRWWATKKDVRKTPGGGYTQEKIDRAGETKCDNHMDAVAFAADMLNTFEGFSLVEIKLLRLGEDA